VVVSRLETSLANCLVRDDRRESTARVGRAVVERQFLASGRIDLHPDRPIVIVDVDGTLAQNTVQRSPYDESKVMQDPVYPEIAQWVRDLYYGRPCEGNPDYKAHTVLIVSGRHSTCGEDTVRWLNFHKIPFHHIFMRHGWTAGRTPS
jgi:hypothetical protein